MSNSTLPCASSLELNSPFFSQLKNSELDAALDELIHRFLAQTRISSERSLDDLLGDLPGHEITHEGAPESALVKELEELILPHSINTGSPHFIGHMTSLLPNFIRPLAKLIASMNQNVVKVETSKVVTLYEKQILTCMHKELYNHPDHFYQCTPSRSASTLGVFTSGGTIANLTALECARDKSLGQYANIEELGVHAGLEKAGFSKSVVICSRLGHYSLKKSLGLLGIGRNNLITIPTDCEQRIDLKELRKTIETCRRDRIHITAIVGIAGTTECCSFDPLEHMAHLAEEFGIHFHVDAAWGGALILSHKYRKLLRGIERADSITIDGHKQLYLPMGMGIVLFKDPDLTKLISSEAKYIIRQGSRDQGKISIEGSRPAHVIYLHAALKLIGRSGYEKIFDKNISLAARFSSEIDQSSEFQLITVPQANIFLYRYLPKRFRGDSELTPAENKFVDSFNIELQETQSRLGRTFVSRTQFCQPDGSFIVALRVVIANPLTDLKHCRQVLTDQREIADQIEAGRSKV